MSKRESRAGRRLTGRPAATGRAVRDRPLSSRGRPPGEPLKGLVAVPGPPQARPAKRAALYAAPAGEAAPRHIH